MVSVFVRLVHTYKKVHKFLDVITYFSTREWNFSDSKMTAVWHKLGGMDQQLFDFDLRDLNWHQFAVNSAPCLRVYLLNETPDTLNLAKQRQIK